MPAYQNLTFLARLGVFNQANFFKHPYPIWKAYVFTLITRSGMVNKECSKFFIRSDGFAKNGFCRLRAALQVQVERTAYYPYKIVPLRS